jgi:hypothetical protein
MLGHLHRHSYLGCPSRSRRPADALHCIIGVSFKLPTYLLNGRSWREQITPVRANGIQHGAMPGSGRGTKMIRDKSPSHTTVYVNFETPNHQTPGQLTTAANRRHGGHQTHDPEVLQGRAVDTAPLAEGEQVLPCYGRRRPQEGALIHATTRSESQRDGHWALQAHLQCSDCMSRLRRLRRPCDGWCISQNPPLT